MSTKLLRKELIDWLSELNDPSLLESLSSIKNSMQSGDWYNDLSDSQKESLEKGIKDHENGQYLDSQEFWSRYGKNL
jgi:hypothetical protein